MKKISFELVPYKYNPENEGWRTLAMFVDGERQKNDAEINYDRWLEAEQKTKEREMFLLVSYNGLIDDLYFKKATFEDETLYQKWYEFEYIIDGEDAADYIRRVPHTKNPTTLAGFQGSVAITEGWKFYKRLLKHDFRKDVAANLAYWRGYLRGMDWNSPWELEGTEALRAMDLEFVGDDKTC